MDRRLAKELMHLQDWLDLASEIVASGQAKYLADPLLQEASDSIMMKIGELARRMAQKGIEPPNSVAWADAVANRNSVIHQYDEIDREVTWNTLSISVLEWRVLFESQFAAARDFLNEN